MIGIQDIDGIFKEVEDECFPSPDEILEVERTMTKLVSKVLKTLDIMAETREIPNVKPIIVGSSAKGTYLKGADIDLFLLFPADTDEEKASAMCMDMGKKVLDSYDIKYASHPYVSGKFNNIGADIVWAYWIGDGGGIISAVDRTPFHTSYISQHLSIEQRRDVRLLKQFLKGIGAYSASLRIEGVSGYLAELLIIRYGSFMKMLKAVSSWSSRTRLALNEHGEETDSRVKMKESFRTDPLVFIDPVDEGRNVAAALSLQNYYRFISASADFLKSPSISFFINEEQGPLDMDQLYQTYFGRGTHLLSINIEVPPLVDDILFPQIRKASESLYQLFLDNGFDVFGREFELKRVKQFEKLGSGSDLGIEDEPSDKYAVHDEAVFLLELSTSELPSLLEHIGPPVVNSNSVFFLEKWLNSPEAVSKPFIRDGRWYIHKKREYRKAGEILRNNIRSIGWGKNISEMVKQGKYYLLEGKDVFEKNNSQVIHRLFNKGEPWL